MGNKDNSGYGLSQWETTTWMLCHLRHRIFLGLNDIHFTRCKVQYVSTKYSIIIQSIFFSWKLTTVKYTQGDRNVGYHFSGLVQGCNNYIALAMELLKSCAKPSISELKIMTNVLHLLNCVEYGVICDHAMARHSRLNHFLAWISDYISSKVWDEITYPFLNFNGTTVEV